MAQGMARGRSMTLKVRGSGQSATSAGSGPSFREDPSSTSAAAVSRRCGAPKQATRRQNRPGARLCL